MLAKHVVSDLLQGLDVVYHRLIRGRRVASIRPEALIEGTKGKDCLAVQHNSLDVVHSLFGNGPESGVALDLVVAKLDRNIVQIGVVWTPALYRFSLERELTTGRSCMGSHFVRSPFLED